MQVRLGPALVAEFVGSFALTFVGIMAIFSANLLADASPAAKLLVVALAHGLVLAVMVSACMPTSGGHINPAITIGFLVTGKIKPAAGIAYIIIQLGGGIVAALAVLALFGADAGRNIVEKGTPNLGTDLAGVPVRPVVAFLAEIIATFFLAFAVWGTAADPRAQRGRLCDRVDGRVRHPRRRPAHRRQHESPAQLGPTLVAGGAASMEKSLDLLGRPDRRRCMASLIYHLVLWPRDRAAGIEAPAMDVPPTQRP